MTIGFMTAFPLLLVMMLSMADINAVLQSPLPYAEVFRQITDSKAVTTIMMSWITVVLFCGSFLRFHGYELDGKLMASQHV